MDGLMPWVRRSGWIYGLIAVVLALVAWKWAGQGPTGGGSAATPTSTVARRPITTEQPIVHVAGEVRRPGVYRIGGDARVIQAIRLAGGPTSRANLQGLNMAAPIADGQQVVVPTKVPVGASASGGGAGGISGVASGPISLSSATAADLEALDGVGPALAGRIVEWRQSHGGFSSVDQLDDVPGIGPARLDALRSHLTP